MSEKNFEEYWEQTRERWQARVADPLEQTRERWVVDLDTPSGCAFCRFHSDLACVIGSDRVGACEYCPVIKVYGDSCDIVKPLYDFYRGHCRHTVGELSRLAAMVVQELDDKKAELIAAMRELWEEANGNAAL